MCTYIHRQTDRQQIVWFCQYICTSLHYRYRNTPDPYLSFVNQITDNGNRNSSISFGLHSQNSNSAVFATEVITSLLSQNSQHLQQERHHFSGRQRIK